MFHITLLAVLVVGGYVHAAPPAPIYHNHHHYHGFPSEHLIHHHHDSNMFDGDTFDARRFWSNLDRQMFNFDAMMEDFYRHFPSRECITGYIDGKYKVTIQLTGFKENEIIVKAKDTVLMVQAVQNGESQRTYMDVRTLPTDVDTSGVWNYDGRILVIEFPMKTIKPVNPAHETTTTAPEPESKEMDTLDTNRSREEMGPEQSPEGTQDADVGLENSNGIQTTRATEDSNIETNFIPTQSPLYGLTYSVDNDVVEFVPVRY